MWNLLQKHSNVKLKSANFQVKIAKIEAKTVKFLNKLLVIFLAPNSQT